MKLTAIVDYQHLRKDYSEDSDMSPVTLLAARNNQRLDQWFGELRLSGENGHLRWLAGVNGLHIGSRNHYVIDGANSVGLYVDYGGTLTTRSVAAFGQAELDVAPRLTLIAGARFTHDAKSYDFLHAFNGTVDLRLAPGTFPAVARRNYGDWSGRYRSITVPRPASFSMPVLIAAPRAAGSVRPRSCPRIPPPSVSNRNG